MKLLLCFILLDFMLFATAAIGQPFSIFYGNEANLNETDHNIIGDVNGDYIVNISDVVAVINTMAGKEVYKYTADVNNDGTTNISDVVFIIKIIAGYNALTFYQKAMQVNTDTVLVQPLLAKNRNIMHVHIGSSASSWQPSTKLADEGVCEVPPTCDRQGLAYGLWKNCVFGNPQYRRYDYGKASLVGNYCDKWTDDSDAFFTESGEWNAAYGNYTNAANSRTTLDTKLSPVPFNPFGNNQHIPWRYSNDSCSSIRFNIPAGYARFAFIYTTNILGDDVSVTTDRNDSVVTIANNIDMESMEEANNATFSTLYTGASANIGYPNRMMHFMINDTSEPTTVTITKSADTDKYLIWWGIVYYSTTENPFAHLFVNNSIGGATHGTISTHRRGIISGNRPNFVTYQLTTTNSLGLSPELAKAENVTKSAKQIADLCKNNKADVAFILQHITQNQAKGNLLAFKECFDLIISYLYNNDYLVIGNLADLYDKVWKTFHSDLTYAQFIALLSMGDGTHLNTDGLSMYMALFSSINK